MTHYKCTKCNDLKEYSFEEAVMHNKTAHEYQAKFEMVSK